MKQFFNTYPIRCIKVALLLTTFCIASGVQSQTANSASGDAMQQLLNSVKEGNRRDQQINAERLQQFRLDQASQEESLKQLRAQRQQAEQRSAEMERMFAENEQQTLLLQEQLTQRLGTLKELFGVLQIAATDAQSSFYNSPTEMHYSDRGEFLQGFAAKMEQTIELPGINEIEQLWFEIHREVTESGTMVSSPQKVLRANGTEETLNVARIGTFNLIADGAYLQRIPETGQLIELQRQPASRYMAGAAMLANESQGIIPLTIDPIKGQLLSLLGTAPQLSDRVHQGGVIGYIIIALGSIVVLVALGRLAMLMMLERRIEKQMKNPDQPENNPLGRIFKIYQQNKTADIDTLELKLSDAVLQEVPKINNWTSFIKISAAIAPLMGLLGTVTGMIITFQAITLFGAGDPKLMAGGISQALVTTVLGLVVAIPSLLLHNLVQGRATKLTEILEQESVAMVAEHAEMLQNAVTSPEQPSFSKLTENVNKESLQNVSPA